MKKEINPKQNYLDSKKKVGYIPRSEAKQKTYDDLGFMSGLEVHQQLKTKEKLFCHCPSGVYNESDDYDAEIIRHMRPTLSELGEYDGTALMEFRTKKEIYYKIKNETACTYEIDDNPPFPINKEALAIAIEISMLSKLNIVGEVHITRKQYLDGSIPAGFQRTAIIGVEGEIQLKNKKIRLIQLSIEEDSAREISDIGHFRTYKTDRLGVPLIETVTYPECVNPDEVKEACDYIRFLNRSTEKVRTGIGAGRQDVNVSCKGGTRVEIKGVAHTKWIPELTHNEVFRQWALLKIKDILKKRISNIDNWTINSKELDFHSFEFDYSKIIEANKKQQKIIAVNLPSFKGLLSHFTQNEKVFADEISDRLKVIACIEKPNMTNSEALETSVSNIEFKKIAKLLDAKENDAQIIIWTDENDLKTALETIEERCKMAFVGVPEETRKSLKNGTTIFERVLPGADRMYPDTDSAPIPLENNYIEKLKKNIPTDDIIDRFNQLKKWNIPEDTYTYILKKNHYPLIKKIINSFKINPRFVGTFFGHKLKFVEGQYKSSEKFNYNIIFAMFKFLQDEKINFLLAEKILPIVYQYPKIDFESILTSIKFKKIDEKNILSNISFLKNKFNEIKKSDKKKDEIDWIMGELKEIAVGNICLKELSENVANFEI